jgi:hypothetical protein
LQCISADAQTEQQAYFASGAEAPRAGPGQQGARGGQGLFYDCPVLGGVLAHEFCHMWWDVSSFQSIQGVCLNLLRSARAPALQAPFELVLASRNLVMADSADKPSLAGAALAAKAAARLSGRGPSFSRASGSFSGAPAAAPAAAAPGAGPAGGAGAEAGGVTKWVLKLHCRGGKETSDFYRRLSNIQHLGIFLTFARRDGLYGARTVLPGDDKLGEDAITATEGGVNFAAANKRRRSSATLTGVVAAAKAAAKLGGRARPPDAGAELEASTYALLEGMVDEARHVLPHLLSMECPADSVVLSQPVSTLEPDRCAELACRTALQMVEDGGRMLLRRRDDCITAEALHKHCLFVLGSLEGVLDHLRVSVEEMHTAMRLLSSQLIDIQDRAASCRASYARTPHSEQYACCMEDARSTQANILFLSKRSDATAAACRAGMQAVNLRDWNLFGKLVEEPKSYPAYGMTLDIVHILRGVILLADPAIRAKSAAEVAEAKQLADGTESKGTNKLQVLRNAVLQKSAAAPAPAAAAAPAASSQRATVVLDMSDGEVCAHASALLSSPDVVNRLLARNAGNVSAGHLRELVAVRAAMRQADLERAASLGGEEEEDDYGPEGGGGAGRHGDSDLAGNLLTRLRELLAGVEGVCSAAAHSARLRAELGARNEQCVVLRDEVEAFVGRELAALDRQKEGAEGQLQLLDAEVTHSRMKIVRLGSLQAGRERVVKAIEEHRQYVSDERRQIDSILKCLVADSCIAATCLARAGWLPEQIRQECLEKFRKDLLAHKSDMSLTESPFVLGCMLDRLQVKRWTLAQQSADSLPRDPASINSMSLVMMNPAFTFVVDPEGAAAAPIKNAYRTHYGIFECTGANFSLDKLERVLLEARGSRSVACVVTECQAGVSQDLITFLTADYEWFESDRPPPGPVAVEPPGPGQKDAERAVYSGLQPVFNGDRSDDKDHKRVHKLMQFYGNFRVVLVSALGPIIDSAGRGTPLPPACFKNMLTVHWTTTSSGASYYMDPKPFHSALGKTFAADFLLENCMVESLCREIAPTHSIQMRLLSERVIEWSMRIINQEGDVTTSLTKWLAGHPNDALHPEIFAMAKEADSKFSLKSSYMTIGYLINEQVCNALLFAESKRGYLDKGVQSAKRLERDMICYQSAVGEACAMAVDFVRVTSVVLPVHLLPPYALTAKAISTKCITGMITQNVALLATIPSSLKDVHRIIKGVETFQKHFLATRGKAKAEKPKAVASAPPSSLRSRIAPGLARGPGAMRSSFLGARGSTMAAGLAAPDDEAEDAVLAAQSMQLQLNRSGQPQLVIANNSAAAEGDASAPSSDGTAARADGPMYLDNLMGMRRRDRSSAVSAMHFFLQPLRTVLLKAAVAYVYNEVKPGFEWMVKFSILLATWAQSSTPLPTDELRALFHFYSRIFSGDRQQARYAFISATAAVPQDIEDSAEVGLPVTTVLLRNYDKEGEAEAGVAKGSHGKRMSMLEQLVGPGSGSLGGEERGGGGPGGGVLSIKDRKTGFWTGESKPLSKSVEMLQTNLASFSSDKTFMQQSSKGAVAADSDSADAPLAAAAAESASGARGGRRGERNGEDSAFRGPGNVDGLNIHRRSTRWRIKSQSADSSTALALARDGVACGQPITRWDPVLCDVPGSEVTVKNEIFQARIVVGNMFELDWLHAVKGKSASISIPGVDARSHCLDGSLGNSGLTLSALAARAAAEDEEGAGRRGSALRITRINSHASRRVSSRNSSLGGGGGSRRQSGKGRPSMLKGTRKSVRGGGRASVVGSAAAGDVVPAPPSAPPGRPAVPSSLRTSLARRTVRKQSVTYILDSPVPSRPKAASVRASIRQSGLVKTRNSQAPPTQADSAAVVTGSAGAGAAAPVTPERLSVRTAASLSLSLSPGGDGGGAGSGVPFSPAGDAALAAAQRHRQKLEQGPGPSPGAGAGTGAGLASPSKSFGDYPSSPSHTPHLAKGILAFFETDANYQEFKILERHPSLAPVFRGMGEGIGLHPQQFLEWKEFVRSLSSIDISGAGREELVRLAAHIIPPQLELEAGDFAKGTSLGMWAVGKELTVIQTLLLTTVVSPASCRAVAELMFSLTDQYLQRGGIVLRHQDELSSDEDSDSEEEEGGFGDGGFSDDDGFDNINTITEGDEDDEEEDEDDAAFVHSPLALRAAGAGAEEDLDAEWVPPPEGEGEGGRAVPADWTDIVRPSAVFMAEDDDDDDDDDEEEEAEKAAARRASRNSERFRRSSRLQLGVSALNCWTHLKHATAGVIRPPGLRYAKKHSQYRAPCRSFENWEAVLQDVLSTSFVNSQFQPAPPDEAAAAAAEMEAATMGGQMENDEPPEGEAAAAAPEAGALTPFARLIKQSKYRILADHRSAAVPYRPFMPIFLGSHSAMSYMSYFSLVCRELGTFKAFSASASPRATVINCSLVERHHRNFYQLGGASAAGSGGGGSAAAAQSASERGGGGGGAAGKGRKGGSELSVSAGRLSKPERLQALIRVVERGISSTAYLKSSLAKPDGGTINILEMLDMHSPACSSIVWAAAVHHHSVRQRRDDDLLNASSVLTGGGSMLTGGMGGGVSASLTLAGSADGSKSVTLDNLMGKNITRAPLSSAKARGGEPKAVGKLAPVPLTAFWETNATGFGPLMSLSEFQFHWLPALSVPDLVSAGPLGSGRGGDALSLETPAQAVQGVIWEQLHGSYLYTHNTIKRLAKITPDAAMKARIKQLSDAEVRVAAGVVTLWKLILFLRSRGLELSGKPGAWSQCLVPLSMWQVARIVFKVSDMLRERWGSRVGAGGARGVLRAAEVTVPALLECEAFRRMVALCAESLCFISYTDVSAPLPASASASPSPSPSSASQGPTPAGAGAGAGEAGAYARPARATNVRSSIIHAATSASASASASRGAALDRSRSGVSDQAAAPGAGAGAGAGATPARSRGPNRRTVAKKQSQGGEGEGGAPAGAGAGAGAGPHPPTAARPSHAIQFSLLSVSGNGNGASMGGSFARGSVGASFAFDEAEAEAGPGKEEPRTYPSYEDITNPALFLKYQYKTSFGGAELRDRLLSTLGRFVAEVIVLRAHPSGRDADRDRDKPPATKGQNATAKALAAAKEKAAGAGAGAGTVPASSALFSAPAPGPGGAEGGDRPQHAWPPLPPSRCDLALGSMGPDGLLDYMARWTQSEE